MSTSRQTPVEMVPAEPTDFVDIEPRAEEMADWLGMLERPDFLDVLPHLKAVAFRRKDTGRAAALMGVGSIPTAMPGLSLPWVWAMFDQQTLREWGGSRVARGFRDVRPQVQEWLDHNAFGFYSSPQMFGSAQKPFVSTLAFLGFRNLGHGLWQWLRVR